MLRRGVGLTRRLRPLLATQRCALSTETLVPYEETHTDIILPKSIEEAKVEYLLAGNSLPWVNVQLMQSYFSSIQEVSHLSWPVSIALGTIALRLAFFPIAISQQRMGQRMQLHTPKLKEMQEELMVYYNAGDTFKSREASMRIAEYKKQHKLSFFHMFKFILVQGPTFMTVFFALRSDYFPIIHPELHSAGYLGFTDLTLPDSYYLLPTINSSLIFYSFASAPYDPNMNPIFRNILQVVKYGIPCVVFVAGLNIPSAVLTYWCANSAFTVVQAILLRNTQFRAFFNLAPMPNYSPAPA